MNKLIRVIVYGVLAVQTIDIVKQWKNVYNKAKALKATAEDYEIANLKRCNIDQEESMDIQNDIMKLIHLQHLKEKVIGLQEQTEKYFSIDTFLFVCCILSNEGFVDIPLTILWSMKTQNMDKIFNIQKELDDILGQLQTMHPTD